MYKCLIVIAVAAPLLSLSLEANGQEKRAKNSKSEEAAKWVATAGEHFSLSLYGCGDNVVLTTDKKAVAAGPKGTFFLITPDEAAAIAQVLVDCGMWGRADTLPEIHIGRFLSIGDTWRLGDTSDDVSSMVIIQHLLKISKGERRQAVQDWLKVKEK
jgi:hypothetical protein